MAQTVCPIPFVDDRERLAAIAGDPNARQKHALRARIILASDERINVQPVARLTGATHPAVWLMLIVTCLLGGLGYLVVGCGEWDPRRPFERNASASPKKGKGPLRPGESTARDLSLAADSIDDPDLRNALQRLAAAVKPPAPAE